MADGNNIVQWVPEQTMRAIVREEIRKTLKAIEDDWRWRWDYSESTPDADDVVRTIRNVLDEMERDADGT